MQNSHSNPTNTAGGVETGNGPGGGVTGKRISAERRKLVDHREQNHGTNKGKKAIVEGVPAYA